MDIKITSGGLEVLASGSVLIESNKQLIFNLGKLSIAFILKKDTEDKTRRINTNLINPSVLEFVLINFEMLVGPALGGTGVKEHINIGSLDNKKLSIAFNLIAGITIFPVFHYTFYLGEEDYNV